LFTGIVEEVGRIISAQPNRLAMTATVVLQGMELGGSIAVNGACLTVVDYSGNSFSVDLMPGTVKQTNLGKLKVGNEVNLERPLTLSKPLGGHLVQGHVDATGRVASIDWEGEAMLVTIEAPSEVMHYVVQKGFIAVDGVSLTVVDRNTASFRVSLVEFTRSHTNLGRRRVGDLVNLEVDIIAKYIERFNQPERCGITTDFLQEHGFLVG